MSDFNVTAGVDADPASLDALGRKIASAVSDGLTDVARELGRTIETSIGSIIKKLSSDDVNRKFRDMGDGLKKGLDGASEAAERAAKQQRRLAEDAETLGRTFEAIGKIKYVDPNLFALIQRNITQIKKLAAEAANADFTDTNTRKRIETDFNALRRASLDSLAIVRRVNDQSAKEANQANERIVRDRIAAQRAEAIAAKQAGNERLAAQQAAYSQERIAAERNRGLAIANRQALWASLLRVEQAGLNAMQAIARTGVSAVSRIWDATLGNVGRTVTQRYQSINQTTSNSLNRTESLTRSSLKNQERLWAQSLSRTEQTVERFQRRVSTGLTGALTGRGVGSGLAIGAGAFSFGKFIADGFNEAKNSIEAANKAQVVFGDAFEGIKLLGEQSAEALGLTNSQALEAAATFGNLLRPLGVAEDAAAFFSAGLTQLGADLASFNNTSLEDALTAIRAGLVGENEPLRRFGVQINEAALKAKALELGLSDGKGTLDAYAKSQAAIALIYEQTALAQGDFARTSDEVANQMRIVSANAKNLFGALIANALPLVKVGLNGVNAGLKGLTDFVRGDVSEGLKVLRTGLIGAAGGLAAVIAAKGAVEVFQLLTVASKALLTPLGLLAVAGASVGAAIAIMSKASPAFKALIDDLLGSLGDLGGRAVDFIQAGLGRFAEFLATTVAPAVKEFADFIAEDVVPAAIDFGEKVGGFVADVAERAADIFQRYLVPAIGAAYRAIREFVQDGIEVAKRAWERFGPVVISVAKRVVSAVGDIIDTVKELSSGTALIAGGIAAAGFAILGPIGTLLAGGAALVVTTFREQIVDGLSTALGLVTGFFERIDWGSLAVGALEFVERVGFIIGNIASDPRTLAAIAGIAAVAAAIGLKFLEGVARGIAENLDELADAAAQIASFLIDAFTDNLLRNTAAIVAAIAAWFLVPKAISAATDAGKAYATSLATGFKTAARSALRPGDLITGLRLSNIEATRDLRTAGGLMVQGIKSGSLTEARAGAGVFAGQLFGNFKRSFQQAGENLGLTTGQQIGTAVAAGLGSALSGQALGKGDLIGGLGGIVASSVAGFAVGGPVVGAAVAGVGLITAAFTASGQSAAKAKAEIDEYRDAVLNAGNLGDVFFGNLAGEAKITQEALAGAGFSIDQLVAATAGQTGALDATLNRLKATRDALESKQSRGPLGIADLRELDGTRRAIEFITGELKEYGAGSEEAGRLEELRGGATRDAGRAAEAAAARYQGLADRIGEASDQARQETVTRALQDAKTEADNANLALQGAYDTLYKLLNPEAGSIGETITNLTRSLPGIGSQIAGGLDIGGALGKADVDAGLAQFSRSIGDAIKTGVEDNLTPEQIEAQLAGLIFPISELDIPQEAKDALIQEIQSAIDSDAVEVTYDAKVKADTASAEAAGQEMAAKYGATIASKSGAMQSSGKALNQGVAVGVRLSAKIVTDAVTAVANLAESAFKKALGIFSPSRVFVGFGENIGQGVVLGVESFMPKVGDASTILGRSVGEAAAEGIRLSTEDAKTALAEFVDELNADINSAQFDAIRNALSGGQTLDEARTAIGADLKGVLDAGREISESIRKQEGGSFAFTGAAGIENRQNVFGIVSNIKDLAETLFEAGKPVNDIIAELTFMRQALLDTAGAAGFNRAELEELINSLGLSQGAINSLATATADAQAKVTAAAAAEKARADAAEQRQADERAAEEEKRKAEEAKTTIVNNFVIPYGDLEAIAATVSNTQQSAAARRVRP